MEVRCFDCNTKDWMKKFHHEKNRSYCDQCYQKRIQPERSKREDLIKMVVPPEPDCLTIQRLEEDIEFVKNCCGVNPDLLGCGALNTMET
jgi:hypothetical protein